MASLRRILPAVDFEPARIPYELLRDLQVRDADFEGALRPRPSARYSWKCLPCIGRTWGDWWRSSNA